MASIELGDVRWRWPAGSEARWLELAWVLLAVCFGGNLYFSINGSLNDPVVHWSVPLAKDFFWLVVLLAVARDGTGRPPSTVRVLVALNTAFAVGELGLIQLAHGSVDTAYVRVFKNFFLYGTLTYLFVGRLARRATAVRWLERYRLPLMISFVLSLGLFCLSPIGSGDGRLYGTYGNPNTAGFAALLYLALIYMGSSRATRRRDALEAALAVLCLLLTQSMTAYAALVTFLPVCYVMNRLLCRGARRGARRPARQLALQGAALMGMIAVVSAGMWLGGLRSQRVYMVLADVLWRGVEPQTQTYSVRRDAYRNLFFAPTPASEAGTGPLAALAPPRRFVRIDATVLAFKVHFGWLGLGVMLLPFALAAFQVVRAARAGPLAEADALAVLCAFAAQLLLFNLPFQYQLEVFPSNFLFASVLGVILVLVSPSREAAARTAADVESEMPIAAAGPRLTVAR
jgi:hypothetical protein